MGRTGGRRGKDPEWEMGRTGGRRGKDPEWEIRRTGGLHKVYNTPVHYARAHTSKSKPRFQSVRPSGDNRRSPLRSPHDIPDFETRSPSLEPRGRRVRDSPLLFTGEISPKREIKKPKI